MDTRVRARPDHVRASAWPLVAAPTIVVLIFLLRRHILHQ